MWRVVVVVGVLLSLLVVGAGVGEVSWLVSPVPERVVAGQPVVYRVAVFRLDSGDTFFVQCRYAVYRVSDGVFFGFGGFSGEPAVHTFVFSEPGTYVVEVRCAAATDVRTMRHTVTVDPLTVQAGPVPFGRPGSVVVELPYPWTGPGLVYVNGEPRAVEFTDGRAAVSVDGNETLAPISIEVVVNGARARAVVPVVPPEVRLEAPEVAHVGTTVPVVVALRDERGPVKARVPFTVTCYNCLVDGRRESVVFAWDPFNVTVTGVGAVNVTARAVLAGTPVQANATITGLDVEVDVDVGVEARPGHAELTVRVATMPPIKANVTVLVDGAAVYEGEVDGSAVLRAERGLSPGGHEASVIVGYYGVTRVYNYTFTVPRHPVRVSAPEAIHAGDELRLGDYWTAIKYTDGGHLLLLYYFPGNSTHAPTEYCARVRVARPVLRIENGSLRGSGLAPGASILVYCNGSLHAEYKVEGGEAEYELPDGLCHAVYVHGSYTLVVRGGAGPVELPSCDAGAPCRLPAPALVAGRRVDAGEAVRLPAGTYSVVLLVDGARIPASLHVRPVSVEVLALDRGDRVDVYVRAPPHVRVKASLSDGRVVELGPGLHVLPGRPVDVWWDYGPVAYKLLVVVRG